MKTQTLWQRNEDIRYVLLSKEKNTDTLTTERRHSVRVTFWRKKQRQSDNVTKTFGMCYILKEKTKTLWQRNEDIRYGLHSEGKNTDNLTTERRQSVCVTFWRKKTQTLWQRNEDIRYVLHSEGKNTDTVTTERKQSLRVTFWRKKHTHSDSGTKTFGMGYIMKEKTQTLWQRNEDSRYVLLSDE